MSMKIGIRAWIDFAFRKIFGKPGNEICLIRLLNAVQLLDRSRRLFSAWHGRDETTDEGFHRAMLTHRTLRWYPYSKPWIPWGRQENFTIGK